jgi:hypothetical protein
MGKGSFQGVKWQGIDIKNPPESDAKVKEKVELL